MPTPAPQPVSSGPSRLLVASSLVAIFGVLIMLLRIAQQNYMLAIGAAWVANGLTMIFHVLYWMRYGLSGACKAAVILQIVITAAPLFFGSFGMALVFLMTGGELRFW